MITVRTGRPDDLPVIVDYNQRLAQESEGKALRPAILERGVRRVLEDPSRGTYYVAEREGRVIGQLMITLEWSDWRDGWLWWIQSVYVHPDARRVGAFKALYRHVIDQAVKQGDVVGIRLYVEHHNKAAQETYKRLGMEEAGYFVLERCPLHKEG